MAENAEASGRIYDAKVLRRLWMFAKPYRWQFYTLIFLTISLGAIAPYRVFLINEAIDGFVTKRDMAGLWRMAWLMSGLLVIQSLGQYVYTYLSGWLGQAIIRDIRQRLFRHILGLRLRFFDNNQVGRLITRVVSDVETLSDVFSEGLAAMAGDVLQLGFILGFMFYTNWQLTLMSLSMFPLLLVATYVFKEGIKSTFNTVRSAVANLNTFVQEHLTGMSVVQLFGAEARELQRFDAINKEHRDSNIKSVYYYSIYFPVAEVIGAAGTGLLVWWGTKAVLDETVTVGMLIAFIMYIQMFFRPIRTIADRFNTLQMGIVSMDRIGNLLDNDDQTTNMGHLVPDKLRGHVRFDKVRFAYKGDQWILKDISFEVMPGQTLALVGATGAGKSSIINLLNRFYDIQQGTIYVDGQPVENYELSNLRKQIGVVLQDVFLFSGSIRENITLGDTTITEAQIIEAAKLVGAWDFIQALPGGFDYEVMERGATLSVGQRQLISFIRAIVYNPSILVLDEATSSVDHETEEMIQAAVASMLKGRTSIIIAHRLSTIQSADQILVMSHGEIQERGTHESLLAQNGYYTQLYRLQYQELVG